MLYDQDALDWEELWIERKIMPTSTLGLNMAKKRISVCIIYVTYWPAIPLFLTSARKIHITANDPKILALICMFGTHRIISDQSHHVNIGGLVYCQSACQRFCEANRLHQTNTINGNIYNYSPNSKQMWNNGEIRQKLWQWDNSQNVERFKWKLMASINHIPNPNILILLSSSETLQWHASLLAHSAHD